MSEFYNSDERILQRVASDFLQRATSATSNKRILQWIRVILQRTTSNEWISTSNEQRVKKYASLPFHSLVLISQLDLDTPFVKKGVKSDFL